VYEGCFAATRVRTDVSWRRAFEMAADGMEATQGKGVRWQPIIHIRLKSSLDQSSRNG
jgi:hypothetical protein